jgi:putative ABC transport system substrate-binding protein
MQELGWVEGKNLLTERRCCAAGNMDRLNEFVADLVQVKVDAILVTSPHAARAVRAATTTIPLVFVGVANPVGNGLVASLAKPGGYTTGVTHEAGAPGDLLAKQIQLIREMLPTALRVGVLINPSNPAFDRYKPGELAGWMTERSGTTVEIFEARTPNDLAPAFAQAKRARVEVFVVTGDPVFFSERKAIAELAAEHRLPATYWFREHAEAGGLMAYSTNFHYLMRQGATYVDRIFRGAYPGDLPVEQAARFELTVNVKTAKALRLTIPRGMMERIDRVIE